MPDDRLRPPAGPPLPALPTRRDALRTALAAGAAGIAVWLGGCALLQPPEAPKVHVIAIERLPSSGLELRFNLKLRVQNPNARDFSFDGVALDLEVNGRPLASGVTADAGTLPRFGEIVLTLPVSVNAVATVRQMLGLVDGTARGDLPYVLRGRVGTGGGSTLPFSSAGVLRLPT